MGWACAAAEEEGGGGLGGAKTPTHRGGGGDKWAPAPQYGTAAYQDREDKFEMLGLLRASEVRADPFVGLIDRKQARFERREPRETAHCSRPRVSRLVAHSMRWRDVSAGRLVTGSHGGRVDTGPGYHLL